MKLRDDPRFWLILRIALIGLNVLSVHGISSPHPDVNWTMAWLVPPMFGAGVFFMIGQIGWNQEVDLSDPLTFTKPFWPITVYPTRFCALGACCSLILGALAIVDQIAAGEAITPWPVVIFGSGVAIYAAIWVAGLMIDKGYK